MAPDDASPPTRGQTRVPIDAEVQLEFENFSGFIREVSANLSLGGMFVKTRYLKPVGTVVRFEFRLSDQYRLIRGTGEVVWTRWRDQPPAMPAGMGIQFLDLDAESRTLVTAIVEQHQRAGGAPFDLAMRTQEEEPEPPSSESARSFADALPAATGAGMTAHSVNEWLQTEPRLAGPETIAPRQQSHPPASRPAGGEGDGVREQIAISFEEPPELPAAAPDGDATHLALPWVAESRGSGVTPARELDWGAAEAMAALGIAPSVPVAAAAPPPPSPDDTLIPPEFAAVAPRPMFSAGHVASEGGGARWALRIAIPLVVIALGGAGWWFVQERSKPKPSTVTLVEGPSSARPPAAAAKPTPSAPVPAPPPAKAAVSAEPAHSDAPAPVRAAAAPPPAPPIVASPAVTASAPPVAPPPAPPGAVNFDAVTKITFQNGGGETEVVLWTNGIVRAEDVEHLRLDDPEPREVLKLRGVVEPFSPSKLAVGNGELRQIRVGFHEQKPRGQLHVVFDLAAHDVRIVSMRADGAQLKIRFGRE